MLNTYGWLGMRAIIRLMVLPFVWACSRGVFTRPRGANGSCGARAFRHLPPSYTMASALSPVLAPVVVATARKKETMVPSDRAVAPTPEALAEVSNLIQTSHAPSISLVKRLGTTIGHVPSSPDAAPTDSENEPSVFALAAQASPLPMHKMEKSLMTPCASSWWIWDL